MRITTGAMSRNYLTNLNNKRGELAKLNDRIASGRKFNRISDNVSDGMRALRVRRTITDLQEEESLIRDAQGYISSAESALTSVEAIIGTVHELGLRGKTGTNLTDDVKKTIAKEMRNIQGQILQFMNNQYAGQYLFAGTNNAGPPFSIQKGQAAADPAVAPGDFLYNKLNASAAESLSVPGPPANTFTWKEVGGDWGYFDPADVKFDPATAPDSVQYSVKGQTGITYTAYKGTDNEFYMSNTDNSEELCYNAANGSSGVPVNTIEMANGAASANGNKYMTSNGMPADHLVPFDDTIYMDIGMGIRLDNGKVDPRSGFQISFSGLEILGCGKDDNASPDNIYNLIGKMADMFEADKDDWNDTEMSMMVDKVEARRQEFTLSVLDIGGRDKYLESTADRVGNDYDNLLLTRSKLEGSSDTDEIIETKVLEYALNATLFMGNKLLGQTLMDYLR